MDIFGRLTLESLPFYSAIAASGAAVTVLGALAVAGVITWFGAWRLVLFDWISSIDHKKIGIMYVMVALVMHWLRSGVVDQIAAAIRNEAMGRQQLAAKLLKGQSFAAYPKGHHLWLSLPRYWNRGDFVAHVLREGLAVVASEAFAVDRATAPHAVRVSLGAARNRTELGTALHLLAAALKTSHAATQVV